MNDGALRDEIAALFRSGPGEPRLGDEPPGEIADRVMAVLNPPLLAADLAEACPSPEHHPGEPDAVLPTFPVTDDGTGLNAEYQCPACGRVWTSWWPPGGTGWPVTRSERAA